MNKRRRGYLSAAAVIATATGVAAASPSRAGDLIVRTKQGKLEGQPSKSAYSFLGIHYGADTGGTNRFLPPKPPESWSGVKKADQMGNRCPQPSINMPGEMGTVLSFSDLPISEDCLVLNVFTPHVHDHAKRAVMVWLHGGGFFLGSGGDKYYEGSNLAGKNDVVVVTLNHRLGAFGYLYLGNEAGPEYSSSELVGMLDIVQALRWVKDNIAQFGGDPDNVTIFGQSGGGGKVCTLTAMPSAQGLFHKAIVESGASVHLGSIADATVTRDKVLALLDMKSVDMDKLRSLSTQDLNTASAKAGLLAFMPVVDGKIVPFSPFDPVASPLSAQVPIMVGSTKDEATNVFLTDPTWQTMTDADLLKRVSASVGPEGAPQVIEMYRSAAPNDKPMHLWTSIVTDQMFTHNSIVLAERKAAQHAAPVYMYKINWDSPVLGGKLRSPHAVELPFVFDNVDVSAGLVGAGPAQNQMAELMSRTFAAFARTGNPNVKGYPHWPAYTLDKRDTFIYDIPPRVVSDPNTRYRAYWDAQAKDKSVRHDASVLKDALSPKAIGGKSE
ncbi:MAG TPA: carboxylesterase/lipase family protein [Steroidobacteraceae bacterium]|jgi:para-nitrobenzyl esterase